MDNQPWHFDHHVLILNDIKGRMNENNVKNIGNKMGKFLEVDKSDVIGINKSLRMRVEIDVTKPLKTVELKMRKGEIMRGLIKYEKLPVFCYLCGRLGHGEKYCEETVGRRSFNESLRVSTPWKANKGDETLMEEGRSTIAR
ncbi:hypothetical protein RDABS01_000048 [Bienertia sinuspersici]